MQDVEVQATSVWVRMGAIHLAETRMRLPLDHRWIIQSWAPFRSFERRTNLRPRLGGRPPCRGQSQSLVELRILRDLTVARKNREARWDG